MNLQAIWKGSERNTINQNNFYLIIQLFVWKWSQFYLVNLFFFFLASRALSMLLLLILLQFSLLWWSAWASSHFAGTGPETQLRSSLGQHGHQLCQPGPLILVEPTIFRHYFLVQLFSSVDAPTHYFLVHMDRSWVNYLDPRSEFQAAFSWEKDLIIHLRSVTNKKKKKWWWSDLAAQSSD